MVLKRILYQKSRFQIIEKKNFQKGEMFFDIINWWKIKLNYRERGKLNELSKILHLKNKNKL